MTSGIGRLLLAVALLVAMPMTARADVLFVPFWGISGKGSTTLIDLEQAAGSGHSVLGASMMALSEGLFGVEADFAYFPRFFERGNLGLVSRSSLTTATGAVVVTLPRRITRESLRPYVLAGLGYMNAASNDVAAVLPSVNANLLAVTGGAGAIGMLRPDVGVRFDLRYLRGQAADSPATLGDAAARLGTWRGSLGLVFTF